MNSQSGASQLQIGELLKQSWEIYTKNVGLLIGAMVLLTLIIVVGNWYTLGLAGIVLQGPLMLGFVALAMGMIRAEPVDFNIFFSGFQRFLPAFMANLLITIFTTVGLFLCIIPGLFVSMLYMLTYYYMFDRKLDFWPSMEASRKTVMANLGEWILFWLVILGINILGALPCFLGWLITGPLSIIAIGLAYGKIVGVTTLQGSDEPAAS